MCHHKIPYLLIKAGSRPQISARISAAVVNQVVHDHGVGLHRDTVKSSCTRSSRHMVNYSHRSIDTMDVSSQASTVQ